MVLSALPHGASAQLLDNTLSGPDSATVRTKGDVVIKDEPTNSVTLDVAATGAFTYVTAEGLSFTGTIDESGPKPSIRIDSDSLEASLEALLEATSPGLDVVDGSIDIDESTLKSKISEGETRGYTQARLKTKVRFSGTSDRGEFTGKLRLSASVSDEPPCSLCGTTLVGVEQGARKVSGCDPLRIDGPVSLAIGPYDEMRGEADMTITNSLGTDVTGTFRQDGDEFECEYDLPPPNGVGIEMIEGNLEAELLGTCHYTTGFVFVGVYRTKCLGKIRRKDDGIDFKLIVNFTAAHHFSVPDGRSESSARLQIAD